MYMCTGQEAIQWHVSSVHSEQHTARAEAPAIGRCLSTRSKASAAEGSTC